MARRRRKVFIDTNNHDRWIVSYADFITLLFAFFVVMYSISSVNEGKYKSLSHSLGTAFSNEIKQTGSSTLRNPDPVLINPPAISLTIAFKSQDSLDTENWGYDQNHLFAHIVNEPLPLKDITSKPEETVAQSGTDMVTKALKSIELEPSITTSTGGTERAMEPGQPQSTDRFGEADLMELLTVAFESTSTDNAREPDEGHELSTEILKERNHLNQVSDQLEKALGSFINDNLIAIKRNDFWIELDMNSELLFLSGEAAVSKKAQPVLKEIAQVINTLPNAINVEGHTDNVPISNIQFPSNWELSSARATSVVQELVNEGVEPTRLSAIGYGEFHPIGDNMTEEGRFKNRRVTLVLMSQAFARYGANDAERAKLLNLKPVLENAQPSVTEP